MNSYAEEKAIIKKIINQDEVALIKLFKQYKKVIFTFIFHKLNNYQLAEEITQDVFIDFIENLSDFQSKCSIKTYLFSIAKNKIIDVIRKKKIKKILFSALPQYIVESLKTILINDEIEKNELAEKIKQVFNKLPNDYQVILRLKYIEGEKVLTIANLLSLKFKAAESLLYRARKAFIQIYKSLP